VKFTNDGKRVFISGIRTARLSAFDARKLVKRMNFCGSTIGIAMDPDGSRASVACSADGSLAVIDLVAAHDVRNHAASRADSADYLFPCNGVSADKAPGNYFARPYSGLRMAAPAGSSL
jgi:hypothetical protein